MSSKRLDAPDWMRSDPGLVEDFNKLSTKDKQQVIEAGPPRPRLTLNDVVADNIEQLRKEQNLSQKGLADKVNAMTGTTWSSFKIGGIERDRVAVTWPDLVKLAVVLDVTIFELVLPYRLEAGERIGEHVRVPDDDTIVNVGVFEQVSQPDGMARYERRIPAFPLDRDGLTRQLFNVPSEYTAPELLGEIGTKLGRGLAQAEMVDSFNTIKTYMDRFEDFLGEFDDEEGDG